MLHFSSHNIAIFTILWDLWDPILSMFPLGTIKEDPNIVPEEYPFWIIFLSLPPAEEYLDTILHLDLQTSLLITFFSSSYFFSFSGESFSSPISAPLFFNYHLSSFILFYSFLFVGTTPPYTYIFILKTFLLLLISCVFTEGMRTASDTLYIKSSFWKAWGSSLQGDRGQEVARKISWNLQIEVSPYPVRLLRNRKMVENKVIICMWPAIGKMLIFISTRRLS